VKGKNIIKTLERYIKKERLEGYKKITKFFTDFNDSLKQEFETGLKSGLLKPKDKGKYDIHNYFLFHVLVGSTPPDELIGMDLENNAIALFIKENLNFDKNQLREKECSYDC